MWHHENVLTSNVDPQSINLSGVTAQARVRSWRTRLRSCGQVTSPGATGKVSPLSVICVPKCLHLCFLWLHCSRVSKAPMSESDNCALRGYPWLAARETEAQKVPSEGNLGKHGRLQHSWDVNFHLSPATQSPWLTQEHKSCLGLSCSVWTRAAPISHPDGAVHGKKQGFSFSYTAFRQ